MKAFTVPEMT